MTCGHLKSCTEIIRAIGVILGYIKISKPEVVQVDSEDEEKRDENSDNLMDFDIGVAFCLPSLAKAGVEEARDFLNAIEAFY
jgi:hypothetical protein